MEYKPSNDTLLELAQLIHHFDMELVKKDPMNLACVAYQTPEICLAAVKQAGSALRYVEKKYRTPELCLVAIKQDPGARYCIAKEIMEQIRQLQEKDK